MSTEMIWQTTSTSSEETERFGELLAGLVELPLLIELRADLGGGKTTLVKGIARGLKSQSPVSSPTFTLSRIYKCEDGREVHHFDFYRLAEPGVLKEQLAESINDKNVLTIIEWSDIVADVLPSKRMTIELKPTSTSPDEREVSVTYTPRLENTIRQLEQLWEQSKS